MRSSGSSALSVAQSPRFMRRRAVCTEAIGRVGTLALEYVRHGDRTVFGRTACQAPWHLLPPIYLDESGTAYTLLINPSGGLVGGDRLSIDLSVGCDAHALISTPSANRVYRSLTEEAVQDVTIEVAENGILEWLPEHTIPFAGSRFSQTIDVQLQPGATLILWDAFASGRIAHGERWRFSSLKNRLRIAMPSRGEVQEQYVIVPADRRGVGISEEWDYVGSLLILGDAVAGQQRTALEGVLAEIVDTHGHGGLLGGVSQPAVPGVGVKLLARSAPMLTEVLMELWAAARDVLWQMPAASFRKY